MASVSNIGALRNKVTFKSTDLSADTYGGYTKANSSYFVAWAELKPKNAGEKVTGEQQTSPHRYDVRIRYRPDKTSLDTSYIMTFDSVDYDIISIANPNMYDKYLKLVVEKNVAV